MAKTEEPPYPCQCGGGAELWGRLELERESDESYLSGASDPLVFRCPQCQSIMLVVRHGINSPESQSWYQLVRGPEFV